MSQTQKQTAYKLTNWLLIIGQTTAENSNTEKQLEIKCKTILKEMREI